MKRTAITIIAGLTLGFAGSALATTPVHAAPDDLDTERPTVKSHLGPCGGAERDAGCETLWYPIAWCVCPPVIVANPGPCPDYDDCSV